MPMPALQSLTPPTLTSRPVLLCSGAVNLRDLTSKMPLSLKMSIHKHIRMASVFHRALNGVALRLLISSHNRRLLILPESTTGPGASQGFNNLRRPMVLKVVTA